MSQDPMDLPTRRTPAHHAELLPAQQNGRRIQLNDQHISTMVNTGAQVAEGAISIAKDLVEIARFKAAAQAEVANIEARSRALVEALRAETAYLMETHQGVRTKGEAATALIRTILENIPEADQASRQKAISTLNELVATVLNSNSTKGVGS